MLAVVVVAAIMAAIMVTVVVLVAEDLHPLGGVEQAVICVLRLLFMVLLPPDSLPLSIAGIPWDAGRFKKVPR